MRLKNKKKSIFFKKILVVAVLIIIAVLLFLLIKSGILNIKNVVINSADLSCATKSQILNSTQIIGRNFFLVDSVSVNNTITSKFICIKNIALNKKFPNQVIVNILNRQAKIELETIINDKESSASSLLENISTPSAQQSQNFYLVDDEGIIFSKSTGLENIPKIYTYDLNQGIGQKLGNSNSKNIFTIFDKANIFGLDTITSVIIDNYFIILSTPKVIFRLDDNIDIQLASLQLILEKAKIEGSSMEFIDLRYDKPIVRYTPKKNG